MAGRYGMSFAKELIEKGDYEEAVDAATKAIADGDAGPEPLFDRASALELLERYEEAVKDLEAAVTKNRAEKTLDPFVLDDVFFSTLLAAAREKNDAKMLERYRELYPEGTHLAESRDWQKRIRGEMPSLLDKTKDIDAV